MFMGKRKKHPLMTVALVGMAAFGVYKAISCIKDKACCCMGSIKCMCGKLMGKKNEGCQCCEEEEA